MEFLTSLDEFFLVKNRKRRETRENSLKTPFLTRFYAQEGNLFFR